jgi:hypothetical protein
MESRGLTVGGTDRLRVLRAMGSTIPSDQAVTFLRPRRVHREGCLPTISETLLYIGDNQIKLTRDSRVSCRNKDVLGERKRRQRLFSRKNNGV